MTAPRPSPGPDRKLFYGLFIFPLIIAAGMIAMVCAIVFMTYEKDTPESLVAAIKTGAERKRWQKASELSNELNRRRGGMRDRALMAEIASILADQKKYDAKTRGYMALALSHFRIPEAESVLVRALDDPDKDVQFYSLWALGTMGARSGSPRIRRFLDHEDQDLRVNAIYVLGALGDTGSRERIKTLLNDPAADIRWNSALALARLGDASGYEILVEMCDREGLSSKRSMSDAQIEPVMINAVKGLALIQGADSAKILESIARSDKSLKVRQAAMDALEHKGLSARRSPA